MAPRPFPRLLVSCSAAALLAGCVGAAPESETATLSVADPSSGRTWVDKRPSTAPIRNAAGATAQYYGGTVTANPKVYVVWWGDPAKINSAVTAAKGGIADFYTGVLNSSFMDWMNEYNTNIPATAGSKIGTAGSGQFIGRGNYVGALTLSNIPSGNVTDAQIQTTLDQAFAAGTLPPPDDNAIYAIYFPTGVSITLDGTKSCNGFGAYHETIIETQRHNANYLVMPDCGSSFKGVTSVSTHELVEALTDNIPTPGSSPDFPQAWNDAMGNEMGDLCSSSSTVTTPLGMFTVQNIWDERTKTCKAFSSDANDFNVALSPNVATLALHGNSSFTVQTATSAGAAQSLTLSATAPTGFTATVTPTTIMSGATATLTVTATGATPVTAVQVVVRADATSGSAVQTHTAALLVNTTSATLDMAGEAPADMAGTPDDLAGSAGGGGGGGGGGSSDDMALGTGVGGNQPPADMKGCGCVIGAHADARDIPWPQATLVVLGLALLAFRRRRSA